MAQDKNLHGDVIWYELLTDDADAAGAFYGAVIGWHSRPSGQPDMDYRLFSSASGDDPADGVAGYMAINAEMADNGARPIWLTYFAVDDVDASVGAITDHGGSVQMPAMDIPGVGRMAMVADPQGAPFYVMRGASDAPSHSFAATAPKLGHGAWNELMTSDPAAAKAFYGPLFGWIQDGALDMGPLGQYEFWWASGKRFMQGAVMPKPEQVTGSGWIPYFRVADIDAASQAALAHGGAIVSDPEEIPGGEYSLNALDPAGARFGLVGPRA